MTNTMYLPDLSSYPARWGAAEKQMDLIAVGWLDIEHPYCTGDVPSDFIDRLESFCSDAMIKNFGIEMCPLCKKDEFVYVVLKYGRKFQLYGTYEIRMPSKDGKKVYAASDFILHFVKAHKYKPPLEFIDAVLNAPLPGTVEYEKFALPWQAYH